MRKLLNLLFSFFKYVLLLIAFGFTLFLVLKMNARLNKNIKDSISVFIPYVLLFILFILNICLDRKYIKRNIFYNITCCLVCATNIIVAYRAMFDTNMVFNSIQKSGVNFNYFNDYLSFNNIMLYGLSVANIVFMIIPNNYDSKEESFLEDCNIIVENSRKKDLIDEGKIEAKDVKIEVASDTNIVVTPQNDNNNELAINEKRSTDNMVNNNSVAVTKIDKDNSNNEKNEDVIIKKIDMDDEII